MRAIRGLDLGEIQMLLDWAAVEGWNPGIKDVRAFQAADPQGFLGRLSRVTWSRQSRRCLTTKVMVSWDFTFVIQTGAGRDMGVRFGMQG